MREDINPVLKVYAWTLFASVCIITIVAPLILHEVFGTILSIVLSGLAFTIIVCTIVYTIVKRHKQESMGEL